MVLVGTAVGLIAPRVATAADDGDALVRKGVELRKQGKDREALDMFTRAAEIKSTPRVLAQLGLAEQALGLWVKAEQHIKAALDAGTDPWIQKNRRALDESSRIIEDHLGSIEVWGEPAGADILIDGESAGTLPLADAIRLPAGEITLTVRAPGYTEVTRQVQIPKADFVREHVELHSTSVRSARAVPSSGRISATATATETANLLARTGETGPASVPEARPIYNRWWFWTAIAVVVGGAGATAFVLFRGSSNSQACDPNIPCGTWSAGK